MIGAFIDVLGRNIGTVIDDIRIIARAARQRIRACPAVKDVRAAVARDRIGKRVAGAVDVEGAGENQVFDVLTERVTEICLDRVRTFFSILYHRVAGVVDDVGVVARTACHRVGARRPIDDVVAAVAGDRVIEGVAGAVDIRRAGQLQVLDVGRQRIGHGRPDRIHAVAGRLVHPIAGVVDDVGVVTRPAVHGVRAGAAVQGVVPAFAGQEVVAVHAVQHVRRVVADESVVQAVARAFQAGAAGQLQDFDIRTQGVVDPRLDGVRSIAGVFDHGVARVVHHVGVVTRTAGHCVGARAAVESIVAAVAGYRVIQFVASTVDVAGAGQNQVFDVVGEGVGNARLHDVDAFADAFGYDVAGVIDDIGIVARAADQGIGPGATVQRVVAFQAGQGVGGAVAGENVVQFVAGAIDGSGADKREIFDVVGQCVGNARLGCVGAFTGIFNDRIASVVDDIGVVAGSSE